MEDSVLLSDTGNASLSLPDVRVQAAAGALGAAAEVATPLVCAARVVPALEQLAGDRVWKPRKAVAQVLPRLAAAGGGQQCRAAVQLVGRLVADASSWVRRAALLAAGPVLCCAAAVDVPQGVTPPVKGKRICAVLCTIAVPPNFQFTGWLQCFLGIAAVVTDYMTAACSGVATAAPLAQSCATSCPRVVQA